MSNLSVKSKISIPDGMPEPYRKALLENRDIVEELFFGEKKDGDIDMSLITPTNILDSSTEPIQNMLHFLDVFIEVFNYSMKQLKPDNCVAVVIQGDSPLIREGIRKFREYFRQSYRGLQYLSLSKFKGISDKAVFQALLSFRAESLEQIEIFRKLMTLEVSWLEKINGRRRSNDLEIVEAEAVKDFKDKVLVGFPYLYEEESGGNVQSMKYSEETFLAQEIKRLVTITIGGFKEKIPFCDLEDPKVIDDMCSKLEEELDKSVIKDLRIRNLSKMTVVKSYMEAMVENCVENYLLQMTKFLEDHRSKCLVLNMMQVYNQHQNIVEKFSPKFSVRNGDTIIDIGSADYQLQCSEKYRRKTYESFQNLVKTWNENVHLELESCQKQSLQEVQNCLERVTGIMKSFGLEGYTERFRSHVEDGLGLIFTDVKEKNKTGSSALVHACKPSGDTACDTMTNVLTGSSWKKRGINKWKEIFAEELLTRFRPSDCGFIRSHEDLMVEAWSQFQKECPPVEVRKEMQIFMKTLETRAKEDPNLLDSLAMEYFDKCPTEFEVPTGSEMVLINGAYKNISLRYQCITLMPKYKDKSLEELRLEELQRRNELLRRTIHLAEDKLWSTSSKYSDLARAFRTSLNLPPATVMSPPLLRVTYGSSGTILPVLPPDDNRISSSEGSQVSPFSPPQTAIMQMPLRRGARRGRLLRRT